MNKIASHLTNYEVVDNDHPFKSRITSIEWHPRKRNFLGVGSKHGDMAFYKIGQEDYSRLEVVQKFDGIGPGGSVSSMKFHPTEDNLVYTSSLCGKVMLNDIEGRNNKVLLDTMNWEFWYSSLDVHKTAFHVGAGRNKGQACLLDHRGNLIWEKRLHTQKISHFEFSTADPNLFCTASLDHTVRLWDLRQVEDKKPLQILFHNKGLNSAYFSLTDGCRLLTTDQKDEIRVYRAPLWNVERAIKHPHRFFQHITPIKAYWHPLKDLIICGRYPDKVNMPQFANLRCIDVYDVTSGELFGEIKDTLYDGIISLTKLNNEGTKLACSMGYNINVWNNEANFRREDLSKQQLDALRKSRAKVASSVKWRGRDGSRPRKDGEQDEDKFRKKEMGSRVTTEQAFRNAVVQMDAVMAEGRRQIEQREAREAAARAREETERSERGSRSLLRRLFNIKDQFKRTKK